MKTHIMIATMALIISACATKRDVASTQDHKINEQSAQHAQMIDGAASRIR